MTENTFKTCDSFDTYDSYDFLVLFDFIIPFAFSFVTCRLLIHFAFAKNLHTGHYSFFLHPFSIKC